MPYNDLSGKRFGRLTVVRLHESSGRRARWVCHCDCGTEHVVLSSVLTMGHAQSCGCLQRELAADRRKGQVALNKKPFNNYRFVSDTVIAVSLVNRWGVQVAEALIDSSDLDDVRQYRWCLADDYVVTSVRVDSGKFRQVKLHRHLLRTQLSALPGMDGDHISRDKLDNRRSNLRVATEAQNSANRSKHRNNTSGFVGVTRIRKTGRWEARISVDGSPRCLGTYGTAEEAARAYDTAALELRGEFAVTNLRGEVQS